MDMIASLLGGLGLFLVGIKGLGANLKALAGPWLRAVVGRATGGVVASALTGLLLGGVTQSSNAVTFIATSLVQAGVLPLRRALSITAFANPGTAGLVLLATVDIRLAVLWLVGVVGFVSALDLDRDGRLKPALGALLGLGLLFLGLDLMKTGAAPLRDLHGLPELTGAAALAVPFLLAALVTLAAQSSSTVCILALTLNAAGVLDFEQTALAVYGASLGSGGAVLVLSASLAGAARRLAIYQALLKAAGVALFLALFLVERLAGVPLLLAAVQGLADDHPHQIGLLFLLLQCASALIFAPFPAAMERLLARLSPESRGEALARPHFLYARALDDPATALDLVAREQHRLLDRLPGLVDPLRAEPEGHEPGLQASGAALERAISLFLAELLARADGREQLDRAVALEAATSVMAGLRETLGEFAETVTECRALPGAAPIRPLLHSLAESLHLLLGQLADLANGGDAEDAAMLRRLTDDRSDMMDGLRRRLVASEPSLPAAAHGLLFRATAQFERAVWLARRLALLLQPEPV